MAPGSAPVWRSRSRRWLVTFLVASVLSTPFNLLLNGGLSGVPLGDAITTALGSRLPAPAAAYVGEAAIDLPDKLVAVVAAVLLLRALPAQAVPAPAVELDLRITLLIVIWYLPSVLLGAAAEIVTNAAGVLGALSGVWGLLVVLAQPAIWSQYLQHGFRGGLDVLSIGRRQPGLASVVGMLAIGLLALALSGLVVFLVGVALTVPYASWVGAHLFGEYSAITEDRLVRPGT